MATQSTLQAAPPAGLFLTGTGTDVGKTWAAGWLVARALQLGLQPAYWKVLQCGPGSWQGAPLASGDTGTVDHLVGRAVPSGCTLNLETAASPHFALAHTGRSFDPHAVRTEARRLQAAHIPIIAEGAGGLRVPISHSYSMRDLAADLGWPLVVVALPGLGTINHTLLTLESAQGAGLRVAGFLFSPPAAPLSPLQAKMQIDNWQTIVRLSGVGYLGEVPRWHSPADFMQPHSQIDALLQGLAQPIGAA